MKKLFLVVIIHILLLASLRYIAWPENLLWSYLNLHGLKFYQNIFYIYTPLYVLLLTLFYKLTTLGLVSLISFSYLIIAVTDIGIWFASKKKILPVLLFIPLQIFFEGNGAWPDQLLAPLFVFGYWALQSKKYLILGVLLGLCLLTKQTSAYFLGVMAILILLQKPKIKDILKTAMGFCLPLIIMIGWLWHENVISPFLSETVVYIFTYHVKNSLEILLPNIREIIVMSIVFIPVVLGGLYKRKFALVSLTLVSALGIFTRFGYFHLQPSLPFAALLLSIVPVSLISYPIFWLLFIRFFITNFHQPPKFLTEDITQNSKLINNYVHPGDRTLFINTWDHYYYLTNTLPIGNYFVSSTAWNLEYDGVQNKMVFYLETEKPRFVIMGGCDLVKNTCYQPKVVASFIEKNYKEVLKLSDGTGIFEYNPVGF